MYNEPELNDWEKMYKHIWSVLCQQSKIDSESQNISLHDVVERLNIDLTKPDTPQDLIDALGRGDKINLQINLELVSFIVNDNPKKEEEIELTIDIFDPDGQALGTLSPKLKFSKEISRMKSRAKFTTLPITTSGTYTFNVSLPSKVGKTAETVAEIPLVVEIKE